MISAEEQDGPISLSILVEPQELAEQEVVETYSCRDCSIEAQPLVSIPLPSRKGQNLNSRAAPAQKCAGGTGDVRTFKVRSRKLRATGIERLAFRQQLNVLFSRVQSVRARNEYR